MVRALVSLLFLSAVTALAEEPRLYNLTGRVAGDGDVMVERLMVVAKRRATLDRSASALISPSGTFELKQLPEGPVELEVVTHRGDVIARHFAQIPSFSAVEIRLPGEMRRVAPSAPVSLYRLEHKVPKEAKKLWKQAGKLSKRGKPGEAETLLRRAIEIDPQFAEALEQLGIYALQRGDTTVSLNYLTAAARLDTANPLFQSHAAVANYVAGRNEDAESYARKTLRLAPEEPRAHYILGLSLLRMGKDRHEAIRSLRAAEPAFPKAKQVLEQLKD